MTNDRSEASGSMHTSWRPMLVIALAQILMVFNISTLQVSIDGITSSFGAPATTVGTAIVAYSLVVAGLIAVGIGGYHVYKGVSRNFLDDLHRPVPGVATVLGVVGYTAKGLAIAGAGILVIIATFTSDPAKATGLDGALKTLGTAPFGQVLLWAAGLGIVVYGAYCFVLARYGRM